MELSVNEMKQYLIRYTSYSKEYIINLSTNRTRGMYYRIRSAIIDYRDTLITYQKQTKNYVYSLKEIEEMTYQELQKICKNYSNPIEECSSISNHTPIEEESDKDYAFITLDEGVQMYGEAFLSMSEAELHRLGYHRLQEEFQHSPALEKEKQVKAEIITYLLQIKFTNSRGKRYTQEELEKEDLVSLRYMYDTACEKEYALSMNSLTFKKRP